jgi:hypothetical protein
MPKKRENAIRVFLNFIVPPIIELFEEMNVLAHFYNQNKKPVAIPHSLDPSLKGNNKMPSSTGLGYYGAGTFLFALTTARFPRSHA